MPVVGGRYICKISETYEPKEGIEALKTEIEKAKNVRLQNIPNSLMQELIPLLKGKKVRTILPPDAKLNEALLELGEVAIASPKADIYHVYKGRKIYSGAVYLPKIFFDVVPVEEEVVQVSTLEYPKCVKCMSQTFEFAWRRSKKAK